MSDHLDDREIERAALLDLVEIVELLVARQRIELENEPSVRPEIEPEEALWRTQVLQEMQGSEARLRDYADRLRKSDS